MVVAGGRSGRGRLSPRVAARVDGAGRGGRRLTFAMRTAGESLVRDRRRSGSRSLSSAGTLSRAEYETRQTSTVIRRGRAASPSAPDPAALGLDEIVVPAPTLLSPAYDRRHLSRVAHPPRPCRGYSPWTRLPRASARPPCVGMTPRTRACDAWPHPAGPPCPQARPWGRKPARRPSSPAPPRPARGRRVLRPGAPQACPGPPLPPRTGATVRLPGPGPVPAAAQRRSPPRPRQRAARATPPGLPPTQQPERKSSRIFARARTASTA
jgi:hypothetical protein